MPVMHLLTILELLESTQPVHRYDTLASHKRYIRMLERLLSNLMEYAHTREEIRRDELVRCLYIVMAFSLRRAYATARDCSPIAHTYGFDVVRNEDYWKMINSGVDAGILCWTREIEDTYAS